MENFFMAHQELQRTLTLWDGVALALGSIAGSGILYLPSLTYVLAGHDVLLVWLGGTLLCVPMLFMFTDMVRLIPNGSGIEGFIARGLGSHVAATVPPLFLSIVVLGIPAGVLIAGSYLSSAIGGGMVIQFVGALAILVVAMTTNLLGAAVGAHVQRKVSWALLLVVVALCALTYPQIDHGYRAVFPAVSAPEPLLSGIVVAFWAYAGFENLTFIAGEFRNPRRDFPLAMMAAFLVCGGLSVALTVMIAALIPRNRVSDFSGLLQLAERLTPAWLATGIIVAFALTIMQLNTASWLWGMSRLLYTSARTKRLPGWFAHLDSQGLPRRAILVLGMVFVVMTGITAVFPNVLVSVLTVASSVFLFLYLLCLVSYMRVTRNAGKRLVYAVFFVFLCATLASVGLKILYPIAIFLLALLTSIVRERRGISHLRKEEEKVCQ
ncbi:APC family permease [Ktedonobacter racemifer]|uniref:Amino acid permease-associated region n=1 Tax=Ktedonobacter racemifer DSM 44963 TaxID=485913 RepID=D6U1N2_KTERA|nr:amino acid permease [Ktedonobacter racemifer]EFH82676.1 amino acid permease-associated region [Ktedonobacter racemifer DSM 44963]